METVRKLSLLEIRKQGYFNTFLGYFQGIFNLEIKGKDKDKQQPVNGCLFITDVCDNLIRSAISAFDSEEGLVATI